ncbi:MAG: hypothetical protein A3K19_17190 [Lentisphaerae bacterium RIFOXYB12_FULL_65_16]|nr:MAG: hypothetical protein A3K18_34220 [Lentisphaerae bacterium RIFOXYA12_64_32]OGV93523.1 MAG: hypothetical protein A3K19_17190 [Lentisphaerae bacterium RIFOXYB12_FULL_65_16]
MNSVMRTTHRHAARALLAAVLVAGGFAAAADERPVQREPYLTGAWGRPATEPELALYLKAGFNLIGYGKDYAEWATTNNMRFISSVSSWGMPRDVASPFEAYDGSRSMSVGLFTHVNFNAPSVEAWWATRVPDLVRDMPHADRTAFWKVHNEFGYHDAKVWDYSPGSVAKYRQWLQSRYTTIAAMNQAWRTTFADFAAIEPPRDTKTLSAALPNWLEWRRFTCWNFGNYFKTTGDLIRQVLPGAAVADNFYRTTSIDGWDVFELARQDDYMAYDLYACGRWPELSAALDVGRCGAAAWDKPFLLMEYHAGPNHWAPVVRGRDLLIEANLALARESRALMWYMWRPGGGGREQGIHGMLDSQGRPTERYTAVAKVSAFTDRLAPLLLRTRTPADIGVLVSSDSVFYAYANRKSTWAELNRIDNLTLFLTANRMQFAQIDPVWVASHDLGRFKVVLVPSLPVLSDELLAKLRAFADAGGVVVLHPDSGLTDGVGQPRPDCPFGSESQTTELWTVRALKTASGERAVENVGKGKLIHCAWEIPSDRKDSELFSRRAQAYGAFLTETTGVQPTLDVVAAGAVPNTDIDARLLRADSATLIFLTAFADAPSRDVRVSIPGLKTPGPAWLLRPDSAGVTRLEVAATQTGGEFVVPTVDPAALVLIDNAWQPLVGFEAPGTFHPGQTVDGVVTVDNAGAETVAGTVQLSGPAGWACELAGDAGFTNLAPGARASVPVRIRVPVDAATDRFGIEYPVTAAVTFSAGRSGGLTARHLPLVLPPLDVILTYQDRILNPWQEMQPEIMRWGWENELLTPPPPPLAIGAPTQATLRVTAAPGQIGREVVAVVDGPIAAVVTPERFTLTTSPMEQVVTFQVPVAGAYRLQLRTQDVGCDVSFTAGVNTETVHAALSGVSVTLPTGWTAIARLAAGVRAAVAAGTPVTFADLKLPADKSRLAVCDRDGKPVAACVGGSSVTLALDAAKDSVAVYTLAVVPAADAVPKVQRVRTEQPDPATMTVTGDTYAVSFDTARGLVRSLDVGGRRVVPHRTGVVVKVGPNEEWGPEVGDGVEGLAAAGNAVQMTLEWTRLQGPDGKALRIKEKWQLESARIAVVLTISNPTKEPVELAALNYELGIALKELSRWQSVLEKGVAESGEAPTGFGPMAGQKTVDWHDEAGLGLGLVLGRCALATKFSTGYRGVRQTLGRTEIGLQRQVRLDPGDYVIAEFELWPHTTLPETLVNPVVVPAAAP